MSLAIPVLMPIATSEREAMLHGKLVVRFLVSQGLDYLEFFRTDRIAAQIEQF